MAPVLSTPLSSSSSSINSPSSQILHRQISSSSVKSLADLILTASSSRLPEGKTEAVSEEGLRHANIKLDSRLYKKPTFSSQLLELLRKLRVPSWSKSLIVPGDILIRKVSGALTNAVFFVSYPSVPSTRTLLLRVYGPSSGSLISRPRELHNLHILSSRYHIGPCVYGTFENGRIEEYFDSVTLTAADIRDSEISRWIGARMAELHSVDIDIVEGPHWHSKDIEHGWEIAANVRSWLGPAEDVLKLPSVPDDTRTLLDLSKFKQQWGRYLSWVAKQKDGFGKRRVFAHNDAQCGNILRLKDGSEGVDAHRQIIVVDFEYAAPNPAAYDIANHFHEWTANYHGPTPHLLTPSLYPTLEQRQNFYTSYTQHAFMLADDPGLSPTDLANLTAELDKDVLIWGAATHAGWAIWGIVQAREDLEGNVTEPEFDYIGYAKGRMSAFRRDLEHFGLL